MPEPTHYVRQGDLGFIDSVLRDELGQPANLQGATVRFEMGPLEGGALVVDTGAQLDQVADGSDGTRGMVHYDWVTADTDTAGLYLAAFRVVLGGDPITYPNGSYILVRISADFPMAAVAPFATNLAFEDRLGVQLTPSEQERAQRLLLRASGLIRDETGQHISFVNDDVVTLAGSWASRLPLPQHPVVDVSAVEVDGVLLAPADYWLEGDSLVRGAGWGGPQASVEVTYDHGYQTIPDQVQAIACEVVARVWVNPGAVSQETSGAQSVTYSNAGRGMLLTEEEKKALGKVAGTAQWSVVLR